MSIRVRIERRLEVSPQTQIFAILLSLFFSFVVIAVIFSFLGVEPLNAYRRIFLGGFGSIYGLSESITKAIPLLLAGSGLALSFKARYITLAQRARF